MMRIKQAFMFLGVILATQPGFSQANPASFELIDFPESSVEYLGIRGSAEPLSWEETLFLKNGRITIEFPDSVETVDYKYVLDRDGDLIWETMNNRQIRFLEGKVTIRNRWNKANPIDISKIQDVSANSLREDVALFEAMIREVHPGTYRYADSLTIEKELRKLRTRFKNSISVGQAYLALSKVTAAIQCDHTKPGFNNQDDIVNAIIHEQEDKLPFTFRWFGDRMIVGYSAADIQQIKRGTEIIGINGVPVSVIQKELLPYVAADGATDKNRMAKLEVDGFDFRYNAFDIFFPLRYPLPKNEFVLEIKNDQGMERVSVHGMHRERRAEVLAKRYPGFPSSRDDTWKFEIRKGMGLLTLNSFGLSGWKAMTIDYKEFLKTAFRQLKEQNVQKLVIDIRKNTGGMDEMKTELFSYLPFDRTSVELFPREGRTRFLTFPESLKPHIRTWGENPWYYRLGDPDTTIGKYYVFEERKARRMPLPAKKDAFQGKVVLLTGPANTSLAFYTARDFRQFGIGSIVGEETGGNQREINGGQILFLKLPGTGIEVDFPVMGAFAKRPMPNAGVIPDLIVHESLDDFVLGVDATLGKAMDLMNE